MRKYSFWKLALYKLCQREKTQRLLNFLRDLQLRSLNIFCVDLNARYEEQVATHNVFTTRDSIKYY